jgi:hypothetical protein
MTIQNETLTTSNYFPPNKDEIELWAERKTVGQAILRLMKRAKEAGRPLTGRDAIEVFDRAMRAKMRGYGWRLVT